MAARRWGEIVRRALSSALPVVAVGCARAEPKDAAATPAATRFFPDARGELSELAPILPPAAAPHAHPVHVRRAVLRVGAGGFAHEQIVLPPSPRSFRANGAPEPDTGPTCPLEGSGECALFAFSRDGVTWSSPRRAPGAWVSFSAGATVAYASYVTPGTIAIDTIDADGRVASWLRQAGDFRAKVHEAPHGPVVVGDDGALFVADVVESDGARRIGAHVPLSIASVEIPLAKAARAVVQDGKRAAWGAAQPVSLLDAAGRATARWGLVWTHVTPPALGSPRRSPLQPYERRAVNECASRSRPLSDPTVVKRLVLTVLDQTKVVRDVVLDHPTPTELSGAAHAVDATPNGVVVDGVAYELAGARRKGATSIPPPLVAPPLVPGMVDDESVTGMAFDAASGDGLVLVARGEEASFGRHFDATGRFVGEPFPLYDGIGARADGPRAVLARVGGVWVAYDPSEGRVAWLTGPLAGQVVPLAIAGRPIGFVRSSAHVAQLALEVDGMRVVAVAVDVRDGTVGAPREVATATGVAVFARANDGAPVLLQAPSMRAVGLHDGVITEPHPDAADGKNPLTYDVGTDVVLRTFAPGGATVLTWIGAGASLWLYEPGYGAPPKTGALLPPVLPSGWVFTPDRVVLAATPEQVAACGASVLVSPRVAVLGCTDSAVRTLAGRRAGLRVLRLPP